MSTSKSKSEQITPTYTSADETLIESEAGAINVDLGQAGRVNLGRQATLAFTQEGLTANEISQLGASFGLATLPQDLIAGAGQVIEQQRGMFGDALAAITANVSQATQGFRNIAESTTGTSTETGRTGDKLVSLAIPLAIIAGLAIVLSTILPRLFSGRRK